MQLIHYYNNLASGCKIENNCRFCMIEKEKEKKRYSSLCQFDFPRQTLLAIFSSLSRSNIINFPSSTSVVIRFLSNSHVYFGKNALISNLLTARSAIINVWRWVIVGYSHVCVGALWFECMEYLFSILWLLLNFVSFKF